MRLGVVGTGYVGLVTGVCFADTGNTVVCADIDAAKVAQLSRGEAPIYEPGLADMLRANLAAGRIQFTTNLADAVQPAEVVFIAVGTPPQRDGSADLSAVEATARQIAQHALHDLVVVTKSTVPVGTGERLEKLMAGLSRHRLTVASNPEFLKEGSAVDDFLRPDRVVIGVEQADGPAAATLRELYEPFVRNKRPILVVRRAAAEMIKYAANCYLATRISFINQVAELCGALGVDVDQVRLGIGYDERIGFQFLYPGIGYGGSCFPKDIPAMIHVGEQAGVRATILGAVHEVNQRQPMLLFSAARGHFGDRLRGLTFTVWGLAFKPKTDDIREAPALRLIDALLEAGAAVRAHDPKALGQARAVYRERITYFEDAYEALRGADGLFVCTEWNEFRSPDFSRMQTLLAKPVIFDGRNVYSAEQMRRHGFDYYSIGRPPVRRN
ncbi:MAG: UDP-glucose/GDP-mannose dehydrogenase family protein [Phycisphaerae bacterium]